MITATIETAIDTFDFLSNSRMAKARDGRLWVIYRDKDNGTYDVKVAYSDDGGVTWTSEVVDAGRGASARCALAVDSTGTIHVVWCDKQFLPAWAVWLWYRNRSSAGVWSGITQIYTDVNFTAALQPDIAIDSADDVHVTWVEFVAPGAVKYRKRTAGVWGAEEDAHTPIATLSFGGGSLAIDSSDLPHITFWKEVGVFPNDLVNIFYAQRTVVGWQPAEQVSAEVVPAGPIHEYPQLALDSSDDVHVVWMAYSSYNSTFPAKPNIYYRKRTGGVWGVEEQVTDVNYNQGYGVSIALNTDDTIHVIWSGLGWGANLGEYSVQHRQCSVAGVWSTQDDLVNEAKYNYLATSLWAKYPSGNILPAGFAFIYASEDTISDLKFYSAIPGTVGGGNPGVVELLT